MLFRGTMLKVAIVTFALFLAACGGGGGSVTSDDGLVTVSGGCVLDQDYHDTDNLNFAVFAVDNNCLLLQTESNGLDLGFRAILSRYNYDAYGVTAEGNDRTIPEQNYEPYIDQATITVPRKDAFAELVSYLENHTDVVYMTGGKLVFLSKFLSDPYRYQLFVSKVRGIYFGLGCDPMGGACVDFNLAMNDTSWEATKAVYNLLHGVVPFHVGRLDNPVSAYAEMGTVYPYSVIYSHPTYSPVGTGDVEVVAFGLSNIPYETIQGSVVLGNKKFAFVSGAGNDSYKLGVDTGITLDAFLRIEGRLNGQN